MTQLQVPRLPAPGPCADSDPTWWYPEHGDYDRDLGVRYAKMLCVSACPELTRLACLRFALDAGETHGIWGGLDPAERFALTRLQRANDTLVS